MEVILLLLAFKCLYPQHFYLARGCVDALGTRLTLLLPCGESCTLPLMWRVVYLALST